MAPLKLHLLCVAVPMCVLFISYDWYIIIVSSLYPIIFSSFSTKKERIKLVMRNERKREMKWNEKGRKRESKFYEPSSLAVFHAEEFSVDVCGGGGNKSKWQLIFSNFFLECVIYFISIWGREKSEKINLENFEWTLNRIELPWAICGFYCCCFCKWIKSLTREKLWGDNFATIPRLYATTER